MNRNYSARLAQAMVENMNIGGEDIHQVKEEINPVLNEDENPILDESNNPALDENGNSVLDENVNPVTTETHSSSEQ